MLLMIPMICRCFNDVKTAVWISTATGLTTGLALEILLENSGLVRVIVSNVSILCTKIIFIHCVMHLILMLLLLKSGKLSGNLTPVLGKISANLESN